MTATLEEPSPGRRRYYVQFTRIGTRRRVRPLTVDGDLDDVARDVAFYARAHQLPGNLVVVIDPPADGATTGVGTITVGGRNAGDFTWTEETP